MTTGMEMRKIIGALASVAVVSVLAACQTSQTSATSQAGAGTSPPPAAAGAIITDETAVKAAVFGSTWHRETNKYIVDGTISSTGALAAKGVARTGSGGGRTSGQATVTSAGEVCMTYDNPSWGKVSCMQIRQTSPGVFEATDGRTTFRNAVVANSK
ncbi:MAG: hypothetical protein GC191_00400 [Azospirillum sp.]|nr:hypothetical protein [Azospirillum sp.]